MEAAIKNRIHAIDLLRGLVMIIMALDHTRDFFHYDAFLNDPLNLTTTTVGLFFTRWVTHFSAPVFVFLSGVSIFLQGFRKNKKELSTFLFKRGLWLIFIELVIVNFSWTFDITFRLFVMQVIWAIGVSMCFMGLMIRLPFKVILAVGLLIVFGHNVLDYIEATRHGFFWDLVRNGDFVLYPVGGGHQLVIIYPFLPWLGLMMLGYCFGKFYEPSFNHIQRRKIILRTGLGLIFFFILLRFINGYGDPLHWSVQGNPVFTLLSFINVHKYPPSLLFIGVTMGPALVFLSIFENTRNKFSTAISVYGQVPFFYYVIHFYILHTVSMILYLARGHSFTEVNPNNSGMAFKFIVPGEGYSLYIVYLVWIMLVLSLYPLCKWFSEYKKKKNTGG